MIDPYQIVTTLLERLTQARAAAEEYKSIAREAINLAREAAVANWALDQELTQWRERAIDAEQQLIALLPDEGGEDD